MERLSVAKAVSDRASKQRLQTLDGQLKKLKAEQVKGYTASCVCMHVLHVMFMVACWLDNLTHQTNRLVLLPKLRESLNLCAE